MENLNKEKNVVEDLLELANQKNSTQRILKAIKKLQKDINEDIKQVNANLNETGTVKDMKCPDEGYQRYSQLSNHFLGRSVLTLTGRPVI